MTNELVRRSLEPAALDYVRDKLAGWGPLEERLVGALKGTETVWALVPPDAPSLSQHPSFDTGGIGDPELADAWLNDAIAAHLSTSRDAVVLMHHRLARWGDAWTRRTTVRLNAFDDALCCLIDHGTRDPDYIAAAVRQMHLSYRTTAFGNATVTGYIKHHEPNWFPTVVEGILGTWSLLLVDAFDGETMIGVERRPTA